ncbi:MAG: prepilin peptidase [Pseudanabaenaceae cyanobacterium bins.68]|nr:prepilin peptidase [Pseudanabaenaceae cyanobacterium bins.68]
METLPLQLIAILLGASIGSFINVVVYRLPLHLPLTHPPSRCPHCLTPLQPQDNIPILGWFLLQGKCRYCHQPISWRYPLIEAIAAFLFWAVAAHWQFSLPLPNQIALSLFLSFLLTLALIDLDTLTLPNRLTQPGLILGLIYQLLHPAPLDQLIGGIIGAVVGIWLFPLLIFSIQIGILVCDLLDFPVGSLKGKELMGGGDAKLSALIGAWLGWEKLLVAQAIATVTALLSHIPKLGQAKPFPFGPFLALGGGIALFHGDKIIKTYLQFLGLA